MFNCCVLNVANKISTAIKNSSIGGRGVMEKKIVSSIVKMEYMYFMLS